jgi:hydrogenase nickel incorporation protein HypB
MCVTCGCGSPALHPTPTTALRALRLEADVLGANARQAAHNRAHFAAHGVTAVNLMSSPGSGKTALLVATLQALRKRDPARAMVVIEGDQQTSLDAERIRATGVPAVQVNTGKGCHLDAAMVDAAFQTLPLHGAAGRPLLFIENVGNLVCPALWDLGEAAKVVVLSVTEGEDKPLKYPDMFAAATLMLINKADLLPHVDFDVERCLAHARRVNPDIEALLVSATRGQGLPAWLDWLERLSRLGDLAPKSDSRGHDHDHDHGHGHRPGPGPGPGPGHGHGHGHGHSHGHSHGHGRGHGQVHGRGHEPGHEQGPTRERGPATAPAQAVRRDAPRALDAGTVDAGRDLTATPPASPARRRP